MEKTSKILVVDDDPDLRKAISALLSTDYAVIEAPNGKEALKIVKTDSPRLMILDFAMPEMNGGEVLKAARSVNPGIVIVMLTSRNEIDIARGTLDAGAAEFITKPFDADYLRAEVARLLEIQGGRRPREDGPPWRLA